MLINLHCPACKGEKVSRHNHTRNECRQCKHSWIDITAPKLGGHDYSQLRARNDIFTQSNIKKIDERLSYLTPLLYDGMRVLEIGCAEGELGRRIKEIANVEYVGIEPSQDALSAMCNLDRVIRAPASKLIEEPYDLIISFHVLEHITDIYAELEHWQRLLKPTGNLVVEVPNEAGHPFLSWDENTEHLHQFTASSLSAVLYQAGFSIKQLSTEHFESVAYTDSLRALAYPHKKSQVRRNNLIAKIQTTFPLPFIVYGMGGNFKNYILPVLADLNIAALVDSNPAQHGQAIKNHPIEPYDTTKFAGIPILITSIHHQNNIFIALQEQGVSANIIFGIDTILS